MRYIDVTLAIGLKKERVYIGETAFILEDVRRGKEGIGFWEEELGFLVRQKKHPDYIERAEAQLVGKTVIKILPQPLLHRIDLGKIKKGNGMREDTYPRDWREYGDPVEYLYVTESVEEIYKLMDEADVREYRKMYLAFKQIRALEDEGLM